MQAFIWEYTFYCLPLPLTYFVPMFPFIRKRPSQMFYKMGVLKNPQNSQSSNFFTEQVQAAASVYFNACKYSTVNGTQSFIEYLILFLCYSIFSNYHKWNRARLLLPEVECTICLTAAKQLDTYDFMKWRNLTKITKLSVNVA